MTKQNQTITVNRLPAKTWNWLKMNETVIGMPRIDGSIAIKQSVAEAGRAEDVQLRMAQQTDWDKITTGMGEAMDQPSETDVAWDTELLTIPEHADCGEPYVYRFSYQSGQHAYNRLHIYAGAHSRAKVILLCESGETGGMISAIQTKVYAGEGAKVELYVVQTMNAEAVCLHDVGVSCEKDAAVKEVQLELGGAEVYTGTLFELSGEESTAELVSGYLGTGRQKIDMNYVARHRGKKTKSNMQISGILKNEAKKLLRGTIDFVHGCVGAKGDEKEDVLLVGDNMVNQTIPLILCAEEDVEGNHGASIGKLDENMLFYAATRGIPPEEAQRLLTLAKIEAINSQIPSEEVRGAVDTYLKEQCI